MKSRPLREPGKWPHELLPEPAFNAWSSCTWEPGFWIEDPAHRHPSSWMWFEVHSMGRRDECLNGSLG